MTKTLLAPHLRAEVAQSNAVSPAPSTAKLRNQIMNKIKIQRQKFSSLMLARQSLTLQKTLPPKKSQQPLLTGFTFAAYFCIFVWCPGWWIFYWHDQKDEFQIFSGKYVGQILCCSVQNPSNLRLRKNFYSLDQQHGNRQNAIKQMKISSRKLSQIKKVSKDSNNIILVSGSALHYSRQHVVLKQKKIFNWEQVL